ncbi:MAG: NAD-dependent epimerase/dehydratase family protein [Nitrosomonadales bacterium]|nr:NAD-dependent epimerase/dehydratase family protein [Nitrosomonadales bacterium]
MAETRVGVLGATGMVGQGLLPLLTKAGRQVIAYSRQDRPRSGQVEFRRLYLPDGDPGSEQIADWVCLAPIWTLPEHFKMLAGHRAERIVALSSTSVFTKQGSSDPAEQQTAAKLARGERELIAWAEANGIEWLILRPTLIYGKGQDRNIGEIARFISRFSFFPLLGQAKGLRQPVHADDVAAACAAALLKRNVRNRTYELSGAERLSYREMVARVFKTMGKQERFIPIPLWLFGAAIVCLRLLPRYRHWSAAMAERMNIDLVFEHTEASSDLGFSPRPFRLGSNDLPSE